MKQKIFLFLMACTLGEGMLAQSISKTAQGMARQGLVDIHSVAPDIPVSLMYSRADNFTGQILYTDLKEAYLHPKAAQALAKAQKLLQAEYPHLSLKVYDATRPMHIQQKMWQVVAGTPKNIYVSNPKNGGGLHNYGMAVDITLCDEKGDSIPMGTKIDYMGRAAHIDREAQLVAQKKISAKARQNRMILRKVMRQAGFKPLRTEWWHFNFITRAEAKAHYKPVK